jgi:hypothetical protein
MIAAPFAGALADRYRFQLFLFFAVLALAASTALTGATSLVVLYGLRAVADWLLARLFRSAFWSAIKSPAIRMRRRAFTMLTASLFLETLRVPSLPRDRHGYYPTCRFWLSVSA